MRLLIDMNLTLRWVHYLNAAGHEAIHWSSIGANTAKDPEICDYAREHGYVLLTNDMDFPQILAHTKEAGPSVVLLRGEPVISTNLTWRTHSCVPCRDSELLISWNLG
jgi:predicted nuclease of predicted toxin-antitoxin system